MIMEVGLFRIDPSRAEEFEPFAEDIRRAFAGEIAGKHTFHMRPALEDPGRWSVLVSWDTVEDHRRFVASVEGVRQRDILARFILGETEVLHYRLDDVVEGIR
jgi:heme-degrading monooxygenase HmoA